MEDPTTADTRRALATLEREFNQTLAMSSKLAEAAAFGADRLVALSRQLGEQGHWALAEEAVASAAKVGDMLKEITKGHE